MPTQLLDTHNMQSTRFYAVTMALARALTTEQVTEQIVNQCLTVFQADRSLIAMPAPGGGEIGIVRHAGFAGSGDFAPGFTIGKHDPSAIAISTRKPLFLETLSDFEQFPASVSNIKPDTRAVVVVPLMADDRVIGAIRMDWNATKTFNNDERVFLQSIANVCALALERARLHDGVQMELAERRRVEERLQDLNSGLEAEVVARTSQMQAALTELEAFSYSVSHDLRAPLRAMDGFSRILLEEFGPDLPSPAQHYLQRIRKNAQSMGALIDDLLAFSRLNRQVMDKKVISIDNIAQQAVDVLSNEMQGRHINLQIAPLGECPADAGLLRQVFVNLLSNAVKFTRLRDPAVIELGGYAEQAEQVYFVRDNGVGFDMQYQSKLFGVFQRLHRAEDYEGTGVGLALVQRIIHRHGGRIWAEGALDRGAAFYFALPREERND